MACELGARECTSPASMPHSHSLARRKAHAKKRSYAKATADCSEAIRLVPKNAKANCLRGVSYDEMGVHEKAIADCSESIRLDPKNAEAFSGGGNCGILQ
jgi:Flp pilus assembly protein TadD